MKTDLLKALVKEMIEETIVSRKKLYCFDFDDSLIKMNTKVRVEKTDGTRLALTPAEYALYRAEPGDKFDFSDFRGTKLINPKEITWITNILRRVIDKKGTKGAVILTARPPEGTPQIRTFFKKYNIPPIKIIALNNSDPKAKANWILKAINKYGYNEIEFFDDSEENIKAVEAIADKVPGTKIIARVVKNRSF